MVLNQAFVVGYVLDTPSLERVGARQVPRVLFTVAVPSATEENEQTLVIQVESWGPGAVVQAESLYNGRKVMVSGALALRAGSSGGRVPIIRTSTVEW